MGEVEALIVEGRATINVQFFKPGIQLQVNGTMRLDTGSVHASGTNT